MSAATIQTLRKASGWSAITFALYVLAGCLVVMFWAQILSIDLVSLVVLGLGVGVLNGSTSAAKWLTFIMLYYFLASLGLLVGTFVSPSRILIAMNRAVTGAEISYVQAYCAVAVLWAGVNTTMLWRVWRTGATKVS